MQTYKKLINMMSLSPIGNGGGVVTGGFVAVLQSTGAAGMGAAGTAAGGAAGVRLVLLLAKQCKGDDINTINMTTFEFFSLSDINSCISSLAVSIVHVIILIFFVLMLCIHAGHVLKTTPEIGF